ncbi:PTS sugar transporter subunit IIA [Caproiciproducens sp.]
MKKILIATHGKLAEGIKHTAEMIFGPQPCLEAISCYVNNTDLLSESKQFFQKISDEDKVIVATDLFSGSVNQELSKYISQKNVFVITGFNLPMILELLMLDESMINEESIENILNFSKEQMIFVNKILKEE